MHVVHDMNSELQNLNQMLESLEEIRNQSRDISEIVDFDALERVPTPTPDTIHRFPPSRKSAKSAEYYQDDLRAGAFQFIEMTTDKFLPQPYQIQIIRKHFGILCWRYPQPRTIDMIRLFPIPISTHMNIKCRMEYFSEAHQSFLHFCDFNLSEIETNDPVIPGESVTANIWRAVILQPMVAVNKEVFDGNDEECVVDGVSLILLFLIFLRLSVCPLPYSFTKTTLQSFFWLLINIHMSQENVARRLTMVTPLFQFSW